MGVRTPVSGLTAALAALVAFPAAGAVLPHEPDHVLQLPGKRNAGESRRSTWTPVRV
jgi:hypothetical protein